MIQNKTIHVQLHMMFSSQHVHSNEVGAGIFYLYAILSVQSNCLLMSYLPSSPIRHFRSTGPFSWVRQMDCFELWRRFISPGWSRVAILKQFYYSHIFCIRISLPLWRLLARFKNTAILPHTLKRAGGSEVPNWSTRQIAHYQRIVSRSCKLLHGDQISQCPLP